MRLRKGNTRARPKFLTQRLARTAREPCALGLPDHRVSRSPARRHWPLETRRFGCLRIDAEREASSRCALMSVFFHPSPPCLNSKKSPGFKRTGLRVGQSETLAVSGLTRNVAFGPRGFVLPFQISRLPTRCGSE